MPASRPPTTGPLQNLLHEAESELHRRLHEACEAEAHGVVTDSTAEIRRLEDTLLSAAMAAERTIVARRHLQDATAEAATDAAADAAADEAADSGDPATGPADCDGCDAPDATIVRQFEDESGRRWRGWPVTPDARRSRASHRSLGEYQDGWICFEALDNSGRRRLPGKVSRWAELPGDELVRLLSQAIAVPARKGRPAGATSDAREGELR